MNLILIVKSIFAILRTLSYTEFIKWTWQKSSCLTRTVHPSLNTLYKLIKFVTVRGSSEKFVAPNHSWLCDTTHQTPVETNYSVARWRACFRDPTRRHCIVASCCHLVLRKRILIEVTLNNVLQSYIILSRR